MLFKKPLLYKLNCMYCHESAIYNRKAPVRAAIGEAVTVGRLQPIADIVSAEPAMSK
jgi:hypothetical protein